MGERDLEVELKEKDEIIMSLRLNEHLLKDKLEISRRNMGKQLERIKELEKKNEQLRKQIQNYEQQYHNLVNAIVKTCNDLGKENIYLGDFDICKRITEYEKELFDEGEKI